MKNLTDVKLEVNCKRELVDEALKVIKNHHFYEELLINIFPLANHLFKNKRLHQV